MIELGILILSLLVCLATGLFVFARNPHHIINKLYGLLTLSLVIFSISNYLSLQTTHRLFYIRLVIASASLIFSSLFYLLVYLEKTGTQRLIIWYRFGVFFTCLVFLLDFTPLVFSGLSKGSNPEPIPSFGAGLFLLQMIAFLASSFILLLKRVIKKHGPARMQYVYMLVGVTPLFVLAPFTGSIMPIVFKNDSLVALSPVYGAFFICMVGLAIVRHRLFDIRFIVARSVAYVLALVSLGAIFSGLIFSISNVAFKNNAAFQTYWSRWFYSFFVIVLAVVFPYIKNYFDKLTNNLFYRDAYDPQVFLDQLNHTLIDNIEIGILLRHTAKVIEDNFKSEFANFMLCDESGRSIRLIGSSVQAHKLSSLSEMYSSLTAQDRKTVVYDELEEEDGHFKKILRDNHIAVIVSLQLSSSSKSSANKYLIIGNKKSGNIYNKNDLKLIGIIANELVIAVQNALRFEEIQNFNVTLQERVNEATRRLRRANERLKNLDETKDDFISMASHQLRTPLTSIKGYLSMLSEGDAGNLTATQMQMINQAYISSQRMVYIISDMLNVSRLKTGKFAIESTKVNLAELIEEEISQLKATIDAHSLKLIYKKPEHFTELMLDETKIRQVIMNFTDNAIYYTPPGGTIEIQLTDKLSTIEFKVVDSGIGVPASEKPHLFTKFYRAGNARKARPDGTGLGLYMAKKVIIAQGGSIIFDSKEGKGSTFGFIFSKAKLKAPEENKQPELASV